MTESRQGPLEQAVHELCADVRPPSEGAEERAWQRLDSLTKPPRSLGELEVLAARIAAVQETGRPTCCPSAITVFAADHGVVAEGVSAWSTDVTAQMVANFASGGAAISQLAAHVGARLVVVDVGVASDTSALDGVLQAKVRPGTRNMVVEPAMTREEAAAAFMAGAELARTLADDGIKVIGTGEMGIGNTTAASALAAAYTEVPVSRVVGRGTGVDDTTLQRKMAVVADALRLHPPRHDDPFGTLAALGGLEIAAMAGVFVGGAAARVCVVADGFISAAAALAAMSMCPASRHYSFGSHTSREPGHSVTLVPLQLSPFLHLDMRLGEGTGAALGIGVMGAACAMMNGMATFEEAGVSGRSDS